MEITFKVFYAIGLLGAGGLIDKMGSRIGYGLSTFLWSLAGIATALVNTVLGFQIVRGALGLTEAGNFPAAIKTVAEWFPKKERALATGIFNSGANIGAILTPLTVPFIVVQWGWQWAFILTGLLGFVWLIFWFVLYEVPAGTRKYQLAELTFIESDQKKKKERWVMMGCLPYLAAIIDIPANMGLCDRKIFDRSIWWFYIFWLPDFFESIYHIKITDSQLARCRSVSGFNAG